MRVSRAPTRVSIVHVTLLFGRDPVVQYQECQNMDLTSKHHISCREWSEVWGVGWVDLCSVSLGGEVSYHTRWDCSHVMTIWDLWKVLCRVRYIPFS